MRSKPVRRRRPKRARAGRKTIWPSCTSRISEVTGGKPADYIPELGKADPYLFGIAIATVDGQIYAVGDADAAFTIQSVSKPFMYGYALQHYGRAAVLKHVGVEPTGEAFNSIVLDEVANRPFNPDGQCRRHRRRRADGRRDPRRAHRQYAGLVLEPRRAGQLEIDEAVFQLGARDRPSQPRDRLYDAQLRHDPSAIPNEVLDLYFRQCSVNVTCRDLAIMAATLANDGTNPLTGEARVRQRNMCATCCR